METVQSVDVADVSLDGFETALLFSDGWSVIALSVIAPARTITTETAPPE